MPKQDKKTIIAEIAEGIKNGAIQIKDILGYEGHYKVTDSGIVVSCKFNLFKVLTPRYDQDGYVRVSLSVNDKPKGFMIHRLVAGAFIENPNSYTSVNHKNEIRETCPTCGEWFDLRVEDKCPDCKVKTKT